MKLIIHIGVEKTGTTSIQDFLVKNEDTLNKDGFHILRFGGSANNRRLAAACMDFKKVDDFIISRNLLDSTERKQFVESTLKDVRRQICDLPCTVHTVIVSSEQFHSRLTTHKEVCRLRDALCDLFEDIKVLMYLRDQGALVKSLYSTELRGGYKKSFSDFVVECKSRDDYFDFYRLFLRWRDVFREGSIECRIFSRERLLNGSIIKDFCSSVGIYNRKINYDTFHSNESFSTIGVVMCLFVNGIFSRFEGGRENNKHKKIMKGLSKRYSGRNNLMTQDQYNEIYEKYSNCNLALGQILGVDLIFEKMNMSPDASDGEYEYMLAQEFSSLSSLKKNNRSRDGLSKGKRWLERVFRLKIFW